MFRGTSESHHIFPYSEDPGIMEIILGANRSDDLKNWNLETGKLRNERGKREERKRAGELHLREVCTISVGLNQSMVERSEIFQYRRRP